MENWSRWKLVKAGFWLAIGFMIPQLMVMYSGTVLSFLALPALIKSTYETDANEQLSTFMADSDLSKNIKIEDYRERSNGNQLLILGSILNSGDRAAGSIQLEAELMDEAGEFVYECSEYISRKLKPGDSENFQIKCGCGDNPVPAHASASVRVVRASRY